MSVISIHGGKKRCSFDVSRVEYSFSGGLVGPFFGLVV